jgi:hypothetical protein
MSSPTFNITVSEITLGVSEHTTNIHNIRSNVRNDENDPSDTEMALIEIQGDFTSFWDNCVYTIEQIREAKLVGHQAFQALIDSAKSHDNMQYQQIAIAMEQNCVDSITNHFRSSRYDTGTIDDQVYKYIIQLKTAIYRALENRELEE